MYSTAMLTFFNCTFVGNQGQSGGAVATAASFNCTRCTFVDNVSPTGFGGAVYASGATMVILEDCVFVNNSGKNNFPFGLTIAFNGGAVMTQDASTLLLATRTLWDNNFVLYFFCFDPSANLGGSIQSFGPATLTNCTFRQSRGNHRVTP